MNNTTNQIIIIGFGSAGYAAVAAIKRSNPRAGITVVDPKEHDLFHPCGLPYALEGTVKASCLDQDIDLKRMGVVKVRGRLAGLAAAQGAVTIDRGGAIESLAYDALILALGSAPLVPPIDGIGECMGKAAFTLHSREDLAAIDDLITRGGQGLVIGGGAIGCETAFALARRMGQAVLFEMRDQVLSGVLDPDLAVLVRDYLKGRGVRVECGCAVAGMTMEGQGVLLRSTAGEMKGSLCVVSAGVAANDGVLRDSGLDMNSNGIVVNQYLQTSVPAVFAAGDCISCWSVIDKSPLRAKLATSSYRQGTVAGQNACGSRLEYCGSAGTFVTRLGELEVAGTGYTMEAAAERGFSPVQGKITSPILPDYFPDNGEITLRVVIDGASGRILGGQAVGSKGAAERINLLSMAVELGLTADDLARVEMAYCPAVSEVYDPLMRAVDFSRRRRR